MVTNRYRYFLEVYRQDGTCLGQLAMSVDFEPALEWTWFLGLRRGRLEPADSTRNSAIQPLWHRKLAEPYLEGVSVTIFSGNGGEVREDFATDYFKDIAEASSTLLVQRGLLEKGERFIYLVLAVLDVEQTQVWPKAPFKVKEISPHLPIRQVRSISLSGASASTDAMHPDDIPVLIPRRILDETTHLSRQANSKETGGILIGHLLQDPEEPAMFVEITAQLPARHAEADLHSLTFTPKTWTAAQEELDLRQNEEIFIGWWHTHPVGEWCKDCKEKNRDKCPLVHDFFSEQDRHLHRTVFPRAYTVALVIKSGLHEDVTHSLFGWRSGRLEPRGFHLIDDSQPLARIPISANEDLVGGNSHVT